jgi:hypothetical protein
MGPTTSLKRCCAVCLIGALCASNLVAQLTGRLNSANVDRVDSKRTIDTEVVSVELLNRVDESTARALAWLARKQLSDGSFPADSLGQPGITSLGTLAFLSWGHEPGRGQYGNTIQRALAYIASCQQNNGLISAHGNVSAPATYNHAISGLAISEAYGMCSELAGPATANVIHDALNLSLKLQCRDHDSAYDGGWGYLGSQDPDLSVAGWHLMFLRSAKNAGFDVPPEPIDRAVGFILRCYGPAHKTFEYDVRPDDRRSRAMAGAGILALAHSGLHNRPEAVGAAEWILAHGFRQYNMSLHVSRTYHGDRYHYGAFYCSQAMFQMGGHYWEQFFPQIAEQLMSNQRPDGAWNEERNLDGRFGRSYTTSLAVLALAAPNQFLPVFQR